MREMGTITPKEWGVCTHKAWGVCTYTLNFPHLPLTSCIYVLLNYTLHEAHFTAHFTYICIYDIYIYTWIHANMNIYTHTWNIHICTDIYVYIYVYIVYTCICMYIQSIRLQTFSIFPMKWFMSSSLVCNVCCVWQIEYPSNHFFAPDKRKYVNIEGVIRRTETFRQEREQAHRHENDCTPSGLFCWKEPYISGKEPYVSGKESYISDKGENKHTVTPFGPFCLRGRVFLLKMGVTFEVGALLLKIRVSFVEDQGLFWRSGSLLLKMRVSWV